MRLTKKQIKELEESVFEEAKKEFINFYEDKIAKIVMITGRVDMGSCQCDNFGWFVKIDFGTKEITFGNSNWENHPSAGPHIPYYGSVKSIILKKLPDFRFQDFNIII